MATRLTLISHAATPALRRAAFPLDESLDERDIAKITAQNWQTLRADRIVSAPERRAQQTAQALGLTVETVTELRDCDYGTWGGLEFDEVHSSDPDGVVAWLSDPAATPHSGDSIAHFVARVAQWLVGQNGTGHTVAVTHPAVIRGLIVHALNAPILAFWRIDIAPLSLTDLRFNGRAWTLRSVAGPLRKMDEELGSGLIPF
jgi:broad specificity phosphatase PhoE